MAILPIYSTRSIVTRGASLRLSLIAGCLFTALIHLLKKNTILSVLAGTLLYVVLRNLL